MVFFDVDGTLAPGSSGQHLAELLGHAETCREVEAAYDAGTMTNQEASVVDARGWAGHTPAEVRAMLETLPLVRGVGETVAWCREHALLPVLATLAWDATSSLPCAWIGSVPPSGRP